VGATAQAGQTARVVVKPTEPNNGALLGKWGIWTGGKSKYDWSGLDINATTTFKLLNQLHSIHASSAQKGYNYHKTGLEMKFGCDDDLTSFQDAVMDHLIDMGMDSISYLPNPQDAMKMISVITSHSCFTIASMRTHSGMLEPLFDDYDCMNNNATKCFLIDLLLKELGALIKKKTQDDDTFVIVWMLILQLIQLTSIEVFEEIKNRIKARHPSQYSGKNLVKLGTHFIDDATLLESTSQYNHNLMFHMVKIFLQVGHGGTNHVDCCPHCVCHPRAHSSNRQQYCPVSLASPKHGFGNGHWTQHQETAA
jgi:hypothetical protein